MGMHVICNYTNFSTTDVEIFEERLTKWCQKALWPGKSMLIFDKNSLNVGDEPQKFIDDSGEYYYYKVVLPNISFTYVRIADTTMCAMYRIWENQTQSVMYNIPKKWDGTELWFGV